MAYPKVNIAKRHRAWEMTNGHCWYCGSYFDDWAQFTVDHITPLSKYGTSDEDNLVPCCKSCNSQKRNCTLDEFREQVASRDGYRFTAKQIDCLLRHGIDVRPIIDAAIKSVVFWAERPENEAEMNACRCGSRSTRP